MSIGFPDYQASPNATGQPIADESAWPLAPGNPFTAQGWVSNFPASRVHVDPAGSTAGCKVNVAYYDDSSLAFAVGQYNWTIAPSTALPVVVPNLAPYVVITVTTTVAGSNNCAIQLTPMVTSVAAAAYYAVGNEGVALNVSVPASGTASVLLPFIVEGAGQWYFNPRDSSSSLTTIVWELSQSGTNANHVDKQPGVAAPFVRPLYAAGAALQLTVTNTDAANPHSFDARIVIDGR